jgi:Kef-type K+ transport system membrane component KefB/nucleotide-binding universal stress UspA family protein
LLAENPIVTFTILLVVILTVPPLFEKLRLPGLVGLLVAGVILGQNGLKLLNSETETMKLLSEIGKVYLMFVAGLEIDLKQFRKTKNRSMGFGFLTFIVPMITGIILGRLFNFGWNASVLIGSLLASHTLLAYPIISRLGVVTNEAVTVTIGATIFTDTAALLVLAVCVGIHAGEFTAFSLASLLIGLAIYSAVVLFGFDWAGKEFFRRSGDAQGNQFLFILIALFVASVGAQAIGVEKIVGAFLAGLAVNDVLGRSPVREKVEFVGSVLFIPCFFVDMGLLIDLPVFLKTLTAFGLTAAIVLGLIGSKFIAALIAQLVYRYNFPEMMTMWSLSLPQVAATLAATLVGYQTLNPAGERLIGENVLNSVIVLMVVTSILGPLITARFANLISVPQTNLEDENLSTWLNNKEEEETSKRSPSSPFTVVVPIYNPKTQQFLMEMAALLARHESGRIVPLAIAKARAQMDDPQLAITLKRHRRRLQKAAAIAKKLNVEIQPSLRIDDDVALGISRFSREQNASLVIMGWSQNMGLRARLFGSAIDSVFWSSHCPIAVTRLLISPTEVRNILVPVKDLTSKTIAMVRFAQILAAANQAQLLLFHLFAPRTPSEQADRFESQLADILARNTLQINKESAIEPKIETLVSDNIAKAIVAKAESFDLVVLRAARYRTAGGLAVSEVTTQAIRELKCSVVLLGEPHG